VPEALERKVALARVVAGILQVKKFFRFD